MRNKRPPIPFNLTRLAEEDSVVYDNDTDLRDVASNKSANIAAKKISEKYKRMRAKKQPLPFNFSDIADTDNVDYNDNIILENLTNKNAIIAAKKISDKYKNIKWKRKRVTEAESSEKGIKKSRTSSSISNKAARIAAKKISDKYKNLRSIPKMDSKKKY